MREIVNGPPTAVQDLSSFATGTHLPVHSCRPGAQHVAGTEEVPRRPVWRGEWGSAPVKRAWKMALWDCLQSSPPSSPSLAGPASGHLPIWGSAAGRGPCTSREVGRRRGHDQGWWPMSLWRATAPAQSIAGAAPWSTEAAGQPGEGAPQSPPSRSSRADPTGTQQKGPVSKPSL